MKREKDQIAGLSKPLAQVADGNSKLDIARNRARDAGNDAIVKDIPNASVHWRVREQSLTPKLSDAAPVALGLAAESAEQAARVTQGRRSLERIVRLVPCAENVCERIR